MQCVFCAIVDKTEPASIFYEDDDCMGFMGIRPARQGECMVIPKDHIDHFTDIDDALASKVLRVGLEVGRKMMKVLKPKPKRIGYIVHGFGVPHAHLIVIPQYEADDIVSGRHLKIENGKIIADETIISLVPRKELDEMAKLLNLENFVSS